MIILRFTNLMESNADKMRERGTFCTYQFASRNDEFKANGGSRQAPWPTSLSIQASFWRRRISYKFVESCKIIVFSRRIIDYVLPYDHNTM